MSAQPQTFTGRTVYSPTEYAVEYLLTVYPDGSKELATRPLGSGFSWSPPVALEPTS